MFTALGTAVGSSWRSASEQAALMGQSEPDLDRVGQSAHIRRLRHRHDGRTGIGRVDASRASNSAEVNFGNGRPAGAREGRSGDLDLRHSAEQIAEFISVEFGDRSDPVDVANQTALSTMKSFEADCPSGATQEAVFTREQQFHDVRRRPIFLQKRSENRPEDIARLDRLQLASTTAAKVLGHSDAILNHDGLAEVKVERNSVYHFRAHFAFWPSNSDLF
jgi:hypothetical protein